MLFTAKWLLSPRPDGEAAFCKNCYDEILAAWNMQASQAARLNGYYRGKYRFSLDEYGRLFVEQAGRCAICETPQGDKLLVVDHDHDTGEVRGLLCAKCNSAIGLLGDSPSNLAAAIIYLEEARCRPHERSA